MKNNSKIKNLFLLFFTFFKIGLFTFGGGYAMIALIEDICVEKKKWISHDDMLNVTVIAESTPGPISINCATYIGYRQAGFLGSVTATIGVILPSFIIIFLISRVLDNFLKYTVVSNAFKGIKAAVGILIIDASYKLLKQTKMSILNKIILIATVVVMLAANIFSVRISSVILIISSAVVSLSVYFVSNKAVKK
ncbi:MAG: chromate transporter [Clostridia bacterium]|nr:chromate transporter [Clostridia bacterium]